MKSAIYFLALIFLLFCDASWSLNGNGLE